MKYILISPFFLISCMSIEVPQHQEGYDNRYQYCEQFFSIDTEAWMECITLRANETQLATTIEYTYGTVHGQTITATGT